MTDNDEDETRQESRLSISSSKSRQGSIITKEPPRLFQRLKSDRSIICLVVFNGFLFAGSQSGQIHVWSLDTFQLKTSIIGHNGAVLGLYASSTSSMLFSSGGDGIVNVWNINTYERLFSIFSSYDVGDIFCLAYSQITQTVYTGAQNTCLQWCTLNPPTDDEVDLSLSHPAQRSHRFFDSKGPGGVSTPRATLASEYFNKGGHLLGIKPSSVIQFAHFGYIYAMLLINRGTMSDDNCETLITGGGDGLVKMWTLCHDDGERPIQTAVLENGDEGVLAMDVRESFLYVGRLNGDVDIWDIETKQLIHSISDQQSEVMTVALGLGLAFTGHSNGYLQCYARYRHQTTWKGHDGLVLTSVVTNLKDQPLLITGGNDDTIALWDISEYTTSIPTRKKVSNEELIGSLAKFVAFRTVSTQPEYTEDCRQAATWLRSLFRSFGASSELLSVKNSGPPIVFAHFKGSKPQNKSTLFYGHYDVVAARYRADKWMTEPFNLLGHDGYLYGRGVSDNKGPVLAALYAVTDLLANKTLDSDIVFLIEGQEECGSTGFEEAIRANKKQIGDIGSILVANSYWLHDDFPCLNYGLRGVVHATLVVNNASENLHSGVSGSQQAHQPLADLVSLLNTLTADDNKIAIQGFYDKILPMTHAENKRYAAISKQLAKDYDSQEVVNAFTASLKARWREPSLTIHRIKTSAPENSTVIPHTATASISIRIVPNQTTALVKTLLQEHLTLAYNKLKTSNKLTLSFDHCAEPWLGDPENQLYQSLEDAIVETWDLNRPLSAGTLTTSSIADKMGLSHPPSKEGSSSGKGQNFHRRTASMDEQVSSPISAKPLYVREGGSIPMIRFLEQEFGAPAAQLPCGQASDNAHLDNERMRLLNLYNSRKIFRKVFRDLGMK